jgi:hypothetical protein
VVGKHGLFSSLYQPVGLWIPSWNPEWLRSGMSNFVPFNREQSFLLPPDLKEWLPAGDVAHFIIAAVERVPLSSFQAARATVAAIILLRPRLVAKSRKPR